MNKVHMVIVFALYFLLGSAAVSFCSDSRYYDPGAVPTLEAPTSTGITYYVDGKNGSDINSGLTPQTAFKTIGKAVDRYSSRMKGGNTIKIRAGLYRERVVLANITGNTDEQHRFTIGPYGDGEVIIDASDTHTLVWSQSSASPNIWVAPCNLKVSGVTKPPTAVVMDDNFKLGRPVYQLSDVNQFGRWWYDSTNMLLYVYTDGASPTAHDVIVVTQDRDSVQYGVKADLQNYVTVYGLTVRGAGSFGIWMTGNNSIAEQNFAKHNGKTGIFVKGTHGKIVRNKTYGNVLLNWPRGKTWDSTGGWPNGGITSGSYGYVSGNLVDSNGGEGIGCMNGLGSIVIEDNISSNNWSANIYLDSQPNDIVRRNLVYNDHYNQAEAIDVSQVPAWTTIDKIRKRMISNGIMMGDEIASMGGTINYQIYNNIIINTFLGISHYQQRPESGVINSIIANNTIILPEAWVSPSGNFMGFELINKNNLNSNSYFINNVIVSEKQDASLVHIGAGATTGVSFYNNAYYAPNSLTPFWLGAEPYTKDNLAAYQSATGLDWNSVGADPMFAATGDKLTPDFYLPVSGSPLIGMAAVDALFSTDFNNVSRPGKWTIGSLEPDSVYTRDVSPPPTSGDTSPSADTTDPVLSSFTMPASASALTVPVSQMVASDNVAVTGYFISESATAPALGDAGWSSAAPASFTFAEAGSRTAYAWAKDAAGNLSAPRSVPVTITLPVPSIYQVDPGADYLNVIGDNSAATLVTGNQLGQSFTLARSGNIRSITVMLATSGAGGNAVLRWGTSRNLSTSYLGEIKAPVAHTNFAPVEFVIPSENAVTAGTVYYFALTPDTTNYSGSLYLRRKNTGTYANGAAMYGSNWNVATADGTRDTLFQVKTKVGAADVTSPTVNTLVMPSSANALTVSIVSLTASDDTGVSGYFLSEDATPPSAAAAQWTAVSPSSFTFAGAGVRTLNVWAKDAAGNVSARCSASVTIVLSDTKAPSLTAFSMPATANGLTVPVLTVAAGDDNGVTGYRLSESSIAPAAGDAGWSAYVPNSFTFSGTGARTIYAWAKDAAGNVSASRSAVVVIDTVLPVIKNVSLNRGGSSVTIKAAATDNIAVTKLDIYVDGVLLKESQESSVNAVWQVTYNGNHQIKVTAHDAAGNVRTQSLSIMK